MLPRILISPPMPWYMENHAEYLIRYLSDEFFIELADVPYPPYENFLDRFPETQPYQRNPDDYDLLFPLLATHWLVEPNKYNHKAVNVWYQPNESRRDICAIGAATPYAEESLVNEPTPHYKLRFGVDTDLFRPLNIAREDDLFHVGMVGTINNPRRMVKEVILPLLDLEGIRIMLFTATKLDAHAVDDMMGSRQLLYHIVSGVKTWPGIPNIYNQLDLVIRTDSDPGYSFPVVEAAACGVPFIATDCGIDKELSKAGAGVLISGNRQYYLNNPGEVAKRVREVIIRLRDNRNEAKQMGLNGRKEVELRWKWKHHIPAWREFFRKGIANALQKRV